MVLLAINHWPSLVSLLDTLAPSRLHLPQPREVGDWSSPACVSRGGNRHGERQGLRPRSTEVTIFLAVRGAKASGRPSSWLHARRRIWTRNIRLQPNFDMGKRLRRGQTTPEARTQLRRTTPADPPCVSRYNGESFSSGSEHNHQQRPHNDHRPPLHVCVARVGNGHLRPDGLRRSIDLRRSIMRHVDRCSTTARKMCPRPHHATTHGSRTSTDLETRSSEAASEWSIGALTRPAMSASPSR